MKLALASLLLACAGCDALFGLDSVRSHDARSSDASPCATGDEDCDGLPNAQDLCPADADTSADSDGDGVGDACDADPSGAEGNHIAFFDGFDDNTGGWAIKSGPWQLGNGVFRQPTIADARVEKMVNSRFVSVEVIVEELATVGNGYVAGFGLAGLSDIHCRVIRREGDGAESLQIAGLLVAAKEVVLTGTGTLRIYGGQRQDGTFYCRARHGANFDAEVTSGNAGPVTIEAIGIETSSASATISSVTLYDVPLM